MIKLVDLLQMQGISLGKYKIHLATGGPSLWESYWQGRFKEWQEQQRGKNFECETVIGLIQLPDATDRWLFAGAYRVVGRHEGNSTRFHYVTELLSGQDDLIGRIVVKYKKPFRNSYIWGHTYGDQLGIAQVLDLPLSIGEFCGYNNVRLSHAKLRVIVQKREPSWWSALSNVGGVYLIMDTAAGKAYVGSAYGSGGIWQRWCVYADVCHGNNFELKALLREKGEQYADNFQYSVLEIADPQATLEQVLERECHWKNVLMSRQFGYNSN